jgi:biopolymer transport protein ExbB
VPESAAAKATSATSSLVDTLLGLPIFQSEWVMYLLIGLSIVSIAVIIERIAFYARHRVDTEALRHDLGRALQKGDLAAAAKLFDGKDALETNPVLTGLQAHAQGPEAVEDLISGALGREKSRYERRLNFLATIASNAPYIGLFGTVLGIIRAYKDLSVNMAEASEAVMAGISEALLATAIGLLVAIPAVIAFNAFKSKVKAAVVDCEMLARLVLAHLKADGATTGPASKGFPAGYAGER